VITNATLYELDEGFTVLSQQEYIGPFFNGDTIQYTSISEALDPNEPLDDQLTKVPKYIQFQILGGNEQGEVLRNMFVIGYTLSCEVEPVAIGNQKGWVEISDYEPAIPAFCGAVTATPSEAPTEYPTTAAPTVTPSEAPTESPKQLPLQQSRAHKAKLRQKVVLSILCLIILPHSLFHMQKLPSQKLSRSRLRMRREARFPSVLR
jgi:hypothetical protein